MNKKNLLALALLMSPLVASAAVTNGQLTFSWTANVPAADVLPGGFQFTDALGNSFTPSPVSLTASVDSDKSLNLVTQTPVTFNVRPQNSGDTLTSVNAYLPVVPISQGFNGKQLTLKTSLAAPDNGEVIVVLNGQAMKMGSSNPVPVNAGTNTDQTVSLAVYAKVADGEYTPGGSVSISTPVIFAVDIAASSVSA